MLALSVCNECSTAQILKSALLSTAFLFISTTASAQASSDTLTYTVKQGDSLWKISQRLGNINFWKFLFEDNKELISDPDFIYPDQVLLIPSSISMSAEFLKSLSRESGTDNSQVAGDTENEVTIDTAQDSARAVQKFREAFEQVIAHEKEEEEVDLATNALELGGLVINKTKSRMGSEFFYAFNDSWRYPAESVNYMLEITEQPSPSMGTIIIIKIDNQQIFKTRLSPRMAALQKVVDHSIYMCNQYLNDQISSSTQINTY